MTAYMLRAGRPMLLTLDDERDLVARGEVVLIGAESVGWLGAPLLSEGRTLGAVVVQSYREELRHSQADMDLLTFVARHIAAALERTRLIDETRQRSAELALVNDVQRGLAEKLDMQAMYDLVGNRIQEIFDAQVVDIGIVDTSSALIRFPYTIERGVRFPDEPIEIERAPSDRSRDARARGRERRHRAGVHGGRATVRARRRAAEVVHLRPAPCR